MNRLFCLHKKTFSTVVAIAACINMPLFAAHVDWDGGTDSTNTVVSGSANVDENWGPSGGGAGAGGVVPTIDDDAFLNDAESSVAVTRKVTVDSSVSWQSLNINQITEPSIGSITNMLSLSSNVVLTLTGDAPLTTKGAELSPVVLDLAQDSILGFSIDSSYPYIGSNTVVTGSGSISSLANNCFLAVDGTLAGASITMSSESRKQTISLGNSAVITNLQEWSIGRNPGYIYQVLENYITDPARWQNGAITYLGLSGGAGNIEAATSTANPTTNSNFRFASIQLNSGSSGQGHVLSRFFNDVQNDGGASGTKEAVYASSWSAKATDSSGGHYLHDLNGQDLYVDRLSQMENFKSKSVQFINTSLDSTSSIRAIDVTGDLLQGGSFAVMNGSALELVGGTWFDTVYNRSVGRYPADSSAVPNSIHGHDVDKTLRWDGVGYNGHTAFNHYLGSGSNDGGNTRTDYEGTDGTLRIVGGDYNTSGYILNPIGVTGTVDTTSSNIDYPDSTLNTVTIRPNAAQTITNFSTTTGEFMAPGHRFTENTPIYMRGNRPSPFGYNVTYYVVNPDVDKFQLSGTSGGEPIIPTGSGSALYVNDINGQANDSSLPGLIVAGNTIINGNLNMPALSGASAFGKGEAVCAPIFQSSLRVGGNIPVSVAVTVDSAADTITPDVLSVVAGQPVYISASTIPGGLVDGQVYYARDVDSTSLKLAAYPGEPAVDITSSGSTVKLVVAEPTDTAELTVTGNMFVEGCLIDGYLKNGANISITSVTGDGTYVTVTTSKNHGLIPGDVITVTGGTASFDGTFSVINVLSPKIFTYAVAASGDGGGIVITYSKQMSVNVSIQSNATVKVAGDVTIGGTGIEQNYIASGIGVGIDPCSEFTLYGGLMTTQTVAIIPAVGVFHVGEGSDGVLSGADANALLADTLVVAGGLDVNGASSIIGTNILAGIVLTNGADMVIGASGSVNIRGTLVVENDSTVDLSAGSISVGALEFTDNGVIDFGDRANIEDQLRVIGNASTELKNAINDYHIISSRHSLGVRYVPSEDYTTITGMLGTLILIQ